MKKLDTFGHVEVALLTEKYPKNPQWLCDFYTCEWTLKEDLDELLKTIEDHVEKDPRRFMDIKIEKLSNHKFMEEYIYGNPFDDDQSVYSREECPECSHLLVDAEKDEDSGRFCSNHDCSYVDEKLKTLQEEEKAKLKRIKENPSPRVHDIGLSLEQFCEKYGIDLSRHSEMKKCVRCKKEIVPTDWFLMMKPGMAVVSYEHEDCDNGPCVMVPFSKKAKKEWSDLLF